jgi:hypothetical protein
MLKSRAIQGTKKSVLCCTDSSALDLQLTVTFNGLENRNHAGMRQGAIPARRLLNRISGWVAGSDAEPAALSLIGGHDGGEFDVGEVAGFGLVGRPFPIPRAFFGSAGLEAPLQPAALKLFP